MKNKIKSYWLVSGIFTAAILALLLVSIVASEDYHSLLLVDDGYYKIAGGFMRGESLVDHYVGPGLPLIFTVIHLFPEYLHPFIRLFLSLSSSLLVILIVFKIAGKYLSGKQLFWGGLIFVLNPVFIHWVFKSSTEIFLALCLSLFVFLILKFDESRKAKYFLISLVPFVFSIFIKPVFLFIPLFLILAALIIRNGRFLFASSFLLIVTLFAYKVYESTRSDRLEGSDRIPYGKTYLINESYWIDYVIKTRQFMKSSLKQYHKYERDTLTQLFGEAEVENYIIQGGYQSFGGSWIDKYFEEKPESGYLLMNLNFVKEKPGLVFQKLLVSPFFFLGLSARTYESFIKLVYSLLAIILGIIGLRWVWLRFPGSHNELIIILAVVLGYTSLFILLHTTSRYSMPVLPLLTVWGGVPVYKLISKLRWFSPNRKQART